MPVAHRPDKSMAMVPVPQSSGAQPQQPRQPTSLQGLLRFAMETTRAEDAPEESEFQPMDEERKKFLEEALKSMTIDVVEELQKQIQVLKKVEGLSTDDDITEYTEAIETILDYVDNIDIANDFHKIGGFMVLYPCLKSPNSKIRAGGCELLAVLCQNNPYCQTVVLDNEFVPMLLKLIQTDQDLTVCTKAMYALAGIVRENEEGFNQFKHYNGLEILREVIRKNCNEKCIIKATFLLENLCNEHPELKDTLASLGYINNLISVISSGKLSSLEIVLSLLVTLLDTEERVKEWKNPGSQLKEVLQTHLDKVKGQEQYKEEEEYSKKLLQLLDS